MQNVRTSHSWERHESCRPGPLAEAPRPAERIALAEKLLRENPKSEEGADMTITEHAPEYTRKFWAKAQLYRETLVGLGRTLRQRLEED